RGIGVRRPPMEKLSIRLEPDHPMVVLQVPKRQLSCSLTIPVLLQAYPAMKDLRPHEPLPSEADEAGEFALRRAVHACVSRGRDIVATNPWNTFYNVWRVCDDADSIPPE